MSLLPLYLPVLALAPLIAAPGTSAWDEATDGDLSGDAAVPTVVSFAPGSNLVSGSVTDAGGDTRDFLTFTVPAGVTLDAIRLNSYVQVPGGDPGDRGFHALDDGPTSVIPSAGTADSLLGGAHVDPVPAGTDLLPELATGSPAGSGFSLPVGPGTYTYVIQQTGMEENAYELDFVLGPQNVPAIGGVGLGVLVAGLLAAGVWVVARR